MAGGDTDFDVVMGSASGARNLRLRWRLPALRIRAERLYLTYTPLLSGTRDVDASPTGLDLLATYAEMAVAIKESSALADVGRAKK